MTEPDEMPDRFEYAAILLMACIIAAMVVWL